MRQHEPVVQCGTPADQGSLTRLPPKSCHEGTYQELLGKAHAGMRRHLESAKLDQAQSAVAAIGGE